MDGQETLLRKLQLLARMGSDACLTDVQAHFAKSKICKIISFSMNALLTDKWGISSTMRIIKKLI